LHRVRVIVRGRLLEDEVLERIRTAAQSAPVRQVAGQVCSWLGWQGPGGGPQVSAAVEVLRHLRQSGLVSFPLAGPPLRRGVRAKSGTPAGEGVAPGPEDPATFQSLEQVGSVELVAVGSRFTKNYRTWRQLLSQHHYLGAGPLAGHQLRYLIKGPQGWLGALAFSAAALQVQARDRWIGWSQEARRENLPYVVNNSRFLILPCFRVPNLASHVLGMASRRLAQDWLEAFGYRPVLVETFVEMARYRGGCYRAANWKMVGLTQGRGRQDRQHQAALPKKIVFVYELEEHSRQRLGALPSRRRLVPKPLSAPPPPVEPRDWAEEEFGGSALPDERLRQRLMNIGRDFFARPTMSIPQACGKRSKAKAVYRFFDNPRVNLPSVLRGHYAATAKRAAQEKVILAVQDTTELNYSAHPGTELLGPICDKAGVIGMLLHDTMAYNTQGTALGLIDAQCWVREEDATPKSKQRYELEIEQKESSKWLVSWQAAQRLQEQCPQSMVVSVGDREADVYELFVQACQSPGSARILVRAFQERVQPSQTEQGAVWEFMAKRAVDGMIVVELGRTSKRKARQAQIEIRYAAVELKAPKRKPGLGNVQLWAITAMEVGVSPQEEPVEWKLLTTVPVESFPEAAKVVGWYAQRFQIEVYHRTLKSGCQIEERQLGNAQRLEGCLAVDMVVAWRIVHLTKLGREVPEVPCTVFFEEAQWKALVAYATRDPRPPEKPPILREAIRMMAMELGGFLGRKSDGEPGTETVWRGLQRLDDITAMWVVMVEKRVWTSPTDRELNGS
jgi:hypothetical protein